MNVVHLRVHSEYSLLQSTCRIEQLVERAKQLGYDTLALTDKNVMYGALSFYKKCQKEGIKPIIGLDTTVQETDGTIHALVLLAYNMDGYQQLMEISSVIQQGEDGYIKSDVLFQHTDGLLAIATGRNGLVQAFHDRTDQLKKVLKMYQQAFLNNLYLGLENHRLKEEAVLWLTTKELAKEHNIPLVAMHEVFYLNKEDAYFHDCLLCLKEDKKVFTENRTRLSSTEFYLKSKEEWMDMFQHETEALQRTVEIAKRCQLDISFHENHLPSYPLPTGVTSQQFLHQLCHKGLEKRYQQITPSMEERLTYELQVIHQMGFDDYFLIVWDFMRFANKQNILTGPGRGSAAGSLVSYVLGITKVDPIKYGLLFERFLNPARITMPDIDIDFNDKRRQEVIEYVKEKYGEEYVAQIITFGTLGARQVIRDVGRIFNVDVKVIDRGAKYIPARPKMTLSEAVEQSLEFSRWIEQSEETKRVFQVAKALEGLPKNISIHAAGVIISDIQMTKITPIQKTSDGTTVTQFSMEYLEELGLLKMDFLGLRTLSFIEEILTLIQTFEKKEIKLDQIPFDDTKTFQLLASGETSGIFQLESQGMREVLQKLKPTHFEDIVAVNALYRPGPMDQIDQFIANKKNPLHISYLHSDLKPILEMTYGIIVYQEQIMQLASTMAGFRLGEADLLRRAVSKKKRELLERERKHFVQGCLQNGYDQKVAEDVYALIVRFANYGFNRSHAVAYSTLSYRLAYLKVHYPLYFYTALLTNVLSQPEKTKRYMMEARQIGIEILPPSINKSSFYYIPEDGKIRMSFLPIKNTGGQIVSAILKERKKKTFTDFFDFCLRLSPYHISNKIIESLVIAGCFDEFQRNRASLLATIQSAMDYVQLIPENEGDSLFPFDDVLKPRYVEMEPWDVEDELEKEQEVFGFYVTSHPIQLEKERVEGFPLTTLSTLRPTKQLVDAVVYIERIHTIKTKKNDWMAFLTISDETNEIEAVIFPDQYFECLPLLKEKNKVYIRFQSTYKNKCVIKQMMLLQVVVDQHENNQTLFLKIEPNQEHPSLLGALKNIIAHFPGYMPVRLYYVSKKQIIQLSSDLNIFPFEHALWQLKKYLGEENVKIQ